MIIDIKINVSDDLFVKSLSKECNLIFELETQGNKRIGKTKYVDNKGYILIVREKHIKYPKKNNHQYFLCFMTNKLIFQNIFDKKQISHQFNNIFDVFNDNSHKL